MPLQGHHSPRVLAYSAPPTRSNCFYRARMMWIFDCYGVHNYLQCFPSWNDAVRSSCAFGTSNANPNAREARGQRTPWKVVFCDLTFSVGHKSRFFPLITQRMLAYRRFWEIYPESQIRLSPPVLLWFHVVHFFAICVPDFFPCIYHFCQRQSDLWARFLSLC